MQVIWQTFLKAFGYAVREPVITALQYCPLHPETHKPTLSVSLDTQTGTPYFICSNQSCGFKGTAVAMVQKFHNLKSFEAAVAMFRFRGRYAKAMPPNIPQDYFDDYISKYDSEVRTADFVQRCQHVAHNTTFGLAPKDILEQLGCTIYPQNVGVYAPGLNECKNAPPGFKQRCSKMDYVIYPYTYNGKLKNIQFQPIKTMRDWIVPETYALTPSNTGVFMEDNLDSAYTKELYITTTALSACLIQSKCSIRTLKKLPIISVTGFPLPLTFKNIQQITLITFNQAPLELSSALELHNNYTLEDQTDRPVRIVDLKLNANELPLDLYLNLQHDYYYSTTPVEWIISTMRRLETSNNIDVVTKAFDRIQLTEDKRQKLLATASELKLQPELISIIKDGGKAVTRNRIVLANQRIISLRGSSLKAIQPNGDEELLCNFGITVETKTRLDKNKLGYKCSIKLEDKTFHTGIHEDDLKSAASLNNAINKTMATAGINGYAAVYQIKNYEWRDILAKLAQDVPLSINT